MPHRIRAVATAAPSKDKGSKEMDISDQINSGGFIKVDHLADGPQRNVIFDIRPGKFDRPDVEFQDGGKLSLNATNMRVLAKSWGTETNNWVGKEVELYVGQTEFMNEKRDSVLIRPISPPTPESEMPKPKPRSAAAPARKPDFDDEIPF